MDGRLEAVCATNGGFFTRAQILDCGYQDRDIYTALREAEWLRVKRAYYSTVALWTSLSAEDQHRVRMRIVAHEYGDSVAMSHVSSCIARRRATFGHDLNVVHVTHLGKASSRREAGVAHSVAVIDPARDVEVVDKFLVTVDPRSIWEAGLETTIEGSLVTVNDALHAKAVTIEQLLELAPQFEHWPRSRHVRLSFLLSDERIESPGESRGLYLFWEHQIPRPELQFEVNTIGGEVVGRTDFAWLKQRHLGEFDGMVKYRRSWREGDTPEMVVEREKRREDLLRGQVYGMSRLIWSDYGRGRRLLTANQIKRDLDQSDRLFGRCRVIIPL